MVQMDTRLPLMVQGPNVLAALDAGTTAASNQANVMRQAEGQNLFRQYGAAASQGDQNALNQINAFDPTIGMGLQESRLGMELSREQISNIRRQAAAAAREQKDQAALRAEFEQGKAAMQSMIQGWTSGDLGAWTRGAETLGLGMLPMNEQGLYAADALLSGISDTLSLPVEGLAPKGPEPTAEMRNLEWRAQQAGLKPGTPEYADFMRRGGARTEPLVQVDMGGGVPADEEALRKKLGEGEGSLWATYLEQGGVSAGTVADMQLLDELIQYAPQGPLSGRLAQAFPGINSAADAFQSVVKRVAPTLRAPGSGSTSDIEYDGMLRSLPQLSARPEANTAIAAMMKAKARINIERAKVIQDFQSNQISVTEARRKLQEIDSRSIMTPELSAILSGLAPSPTTPAAPAPDGVPEDVWGVMTPEERALWEN